jgi:hypothetical protein
LPAGLIRGLIHPDRSTGIGFKIEAAYPGVFSDTPETSGAEFWEALQALLCIGERAYSTITRMERHTAKVEEWLAHLAEPPGTLDPATSCPLDQPDPASWHPQVVMSVSEEAARPSTPAPEAREEAATAGNASEPTKCTPRKAGLVQLGERLDFERDEQYRLLKHCLTKDPNKVCSYKSAADFFAALNLSPCWQHWHQQALSAVAGVTELGAKINGWQESWRKEGGPPAEKRAPGESDKEGPPSYGLKPCSWATDLAETVRAPLSPRSRPSP